MPGAPKTTKAKRLDINLFFSRVKSRGHVIPVNQIPPGFNPVCAPVLVLQIIRVLPDV